MAQNMQNGNVPNIVEGRAGWYPRWWLLAALAYGIILTILMSLWTPIICPPQQAQQTLPAICSLVSTQSYLVKALFFWLLFIALWILMVIYLLPLVEVPRRDESSIPSILGNILRVISQFSALHYMLLLQGIIAFILMNVMWWQDHSPPAAFATLSIIAFLAHCSHFHHTPRRSHRNYLIGYGVIAALNLLVQLLFRRNFWPNWPSPNNEWPLVAVEIGLVVIGFAALFYQPRHAHHATAQAARDAYIDQRLEPGNIFRNIWPFSRLFPQPPPPVQAPDLPGNPDPGAP